MGDHQDIAMTFALDLLDTLQEEAPQVVLSVVKSAAQSGDQLIVQRWLDDHLEREQAASPEMLGVKDPEFFRSMLTLSTFSDGAPTSAASAQAAKTFGQWIKNAVLPQCKAGDPFLGNLLTECVNSIRPTMESAGRELMSLGAHGMTIARDSADEPIDLAGVKLGLRQKQETLLALALVRQHPLVADLVQQVSAGKVAWPVIAQVEVDGKFHPVNAAGHCLATGDLKMLRTVLAKTQGDEHARSQGLAHAIDFALSSGLSNHCTPEVAQGIAMCIAAGADLDFSRIGQRLTQTRVTLAAEASDVDAQAAGDYAMAALFMSPRTSSAALASISRLVNTYQLPINGAVTASGNRASLLHYAAAAGQPDLIQGLIKLGADEAAKDSRGFTPKNWAQMLDRPAAWSCLDPNAPVHQEAAAAVTAPVALAPAHEFDDPTMDAPWDPEGEWVDDGMEDAAEQAMLSIQQVQSQEAPVDKAPAVVADRDKVAPAMTQAQASRGAALFARLKTSQANIAAKSVTTQPGEPAESAATAGKKPGVAFRR
jgi:hypothetical protein